MTTPAHRVRAAVVSGVATTVYYALPDLVPSRTARGWGKVACMAAIAAVSLPSRQELDEARAAWHDASARLKGLDEGVAPVLDDAVTLDDAASLDDPGQDVAPDDVADEAPADGAPSGARRRAAVVGAVGTVLVVGSVVATVAGEKWLFRRGERRAAAGVRFPHTRTGVAMGVLSAAAALIPEPPKQP